MLFILVSCFSFLLLSKSFLKPKPPSKRTESREMSTLPWTFWEELPKFLMLLGRKRKILVRVFRFPSIKRILSAAKFETVEEEIEEDERERVCLLDLPDLPLDCILEKLSPAGLCSMAGVCSSLREKCRSDHLWQNHLKQKWGGVIGEAAYREWLRQLASQGASKFLHCTVQKSKFQFFLNLFRCISDVKERQHNSRSSLPVNSVISFYLALESGKFWFPAQVFNREVQNGHVGFVLSCYDAKLSYDSTADNFVARYPCQGRSMIEENIEWSRIRAAAIVHTSPDALHTSDRLDELRPDDPVEIQWRRNKHFPFGWWYGVVGHLESCSGIQFNCQCHINETVVLEFRQYAPGSRWRKTIISRADHREVGNDAEGFYGGIRKLCKKEEIAKWSTLWPNCTLE